MPSQPLPSRHFGVAEARNAGVRRSRLYAADLSRPHYGARIVGKGGWFDEVAALMVVLPPDALLSHSSALRWYELPLPTGWEGSELIHVTLPGQGRRVRRPGVVGHSGIRSRTAVRGVAVTSPVEALIDCAAALTEFDAVMIGDAILSRWPDTQLRQMVATASVRRGRTMLKSAVPRMRSGSASPMETRCRLHFEDWGLPEPELNVDVFDASGQWLARVDFLWRSIGLIAEYYGGTHQQSWAQDIVRIRALEDAGFSTEVILARDLGVERAQLRLRLLSYFT